MSAVREQLRELLARFDDEAFAALANRGLLRRAYKDLESTTPEIVEDRDDLLTIAIGGQQVRFDPRGPAQARCTCPATAVCQHILAASIGLQRMLGEASGQDAIPGGDIPHAARIDPAAEAVSVNDAPVEAAHAESAAAPDPLDELQRLLLRIPHADLLKHAGKAGYRWAWQFVQDLDIEQGLRIGGERHLIIGFVSPRLTFRYMGGAIDALVADNAPAQIEKYRVAAVLACRRAHGLDLVAPETGGRQRAQELDLGKDHALATASGEALTDSRTRLRAAVAQLCGECVELGLSHLSQAIRQRFETLAVWAQGAEYYRLALLLRRLADHVELLLERAGGADEHVLLDEISLVSALIAALDAAAVRGLQPAALVGQARSRYDEAGQLRLLGLGASAWRSASGYVGLTMLFWAPAERAFFSCSDARPELQRAFDPIARYKAAGPWSGLGAPAAATGRSLALVGAQINAAGRLSAADSATATVSPMGIEDFVANLAPESDWSALRLRRHLDRRSLLSEPQPMKDWAVIRPERIGAATFDSTRQTLVWPVFDSADDVLRIELPYSEYNAHAIERVERMAMDAWRPDTLLTVRLREGPEGMVAEPLSAIGAGRSDGNPVDALHFDPAPASGGLKSMLPKGMRPKGKLAKWLGGPEDRHPEHAVSAMGAAALLPKPLRELRYWLRRQSERGVHREHALIVQREAETRLSALRAIGLSAFAPITEVEPAAAMLIRLNYVCLQHERLLGAGQEEPVD